MENERFSKIELCRAQAQKEHVGNAPIPLPLGCGIKEISTTDLAALRSLCDHVVGNFRAMVPWGEGWDDVKVRGYALLPKNISRWWSVKTILSTGIRMESSADEENCFSAGKQRKKRNKHNYTIKNAFTQMNLTKSQESAVRSVVQAAESIVRSQHSHLQTCELECVTLDNLVAIQPNVHNGDPVLPLHMDEPRNDGFGIVIATLALWGCGDVVLLDDGEPPAANTTFESKTDMNTNTTSTAKPIRTSGSSVVAETKLDYKHMAYDGNADDDCDGSHDSSKKPLESPFEKIIESHNAAAKCWSFHLRPGQLYVLSGPARNLCAHGVISYECQQDPCSHPNCIAAITTAGVAVGAGSSTNDTIAGDKGVGILDTKRASLDGCRKRNMAHIAGIKSDCPAAGVVDACFRKSKRLLARKVGTTGVKRVTGKVSTEFGSSNGFDYVADSSTDGSSSSSSSSDKAEMLYEAPGSGQGMDYTIGCQPPSNFARSTFNNRSSRVSLNFRFGIHSAEQAYELIEQHWA